jgi:hypothetical protein
MRPQDYGRRRIVGRGSAKWHVVSQHPRNHAAISSVPVKQSISYIDLFRGFYITARGRDEGFDRPDNLPRVTTESKVNDGSAQHKVSLQQSRTLRHL